MTASPTAQDRLINPGLWLLIVAGIAGVIFFFAKFEESFPAASIDLRLSKSEIQRQSQPWSEYSGYDPRQAVSSTIFTYDDYAKTYLEYELGQSKANELMKDKVPIWYWNTRYCKPFQQEECNVWIGPDGRLRAFRRDIENDRKLPSIPHAEAQKRAKDFLQDKMQISLTDYKLVKDIETKQLHRTDHGFTWEDQVHPFKDAHLRLYVGISGDAVTDFNRYLNVPEKFTRKFNEIRSYNALLKSISSIFYSILSSAMLFAFLWAFAAGRVRWKMAIGLGLFAGVMQLLETANGIPNLIYSYSTTMSFQGYLVDRAISALLGASAAAIGYIIMFGGLEAVYRWAYPHKVAMENFFSARGLHSRQIFQGLVAGIALFGVHTAYVVIYYLFGQQVGIWSPLEVRNATVLSSVVPAFSAVMVGVSASTSEELLYRVLGLTLIQKVVRNFWLANLLQAAAWAFMHSDYPQEPAWARGVELTIGGFFYGFILRQFGLLPCIVAHYTYDAFLGITPLLFSPDLNLQLSGVAATIPAALALLVSGVLIAKRGLFEPEKELYNESVPVKRSLETHQEAPPAVTFYYQPLAKKIRTGLVIAIIIGFALWAFLPVRTIGVKEQVTMSMGDAVVTAREYLVKNGIDPKGLWHTAYVIDYSDSMQMQYVFETLNYERTAELAKEAAPFLFWKVRFFKPADPTEWYVTLTSTGHPVGLSSVKEEDAAGAKLTQEIARQKVEDFLNKEHAEIKPYEFVDASKQERKNRSDYDFTYNVPRMKVGDAEYRIWIETIGDVVSGFNSGWQIPDKWMFEKRKLDTREQICGHLKTAFWVIMCIFLLRWAVGIIRSQALRWRVPIIFGVLSAVLSLASQLNELPTLFYSYSTDVPVMTFLTDQGVRYVISMLSAGSGVAFGLAFAVASYRILFPRLPLRAMYETMLKPFENTLPLRRQYWFDAVVLGFAYAFVTIGLDRVFDLVRSYVSPSVNMISLSGMSAIADDLSPALGVVIDALNSGFTNLIAMAIAAGVAAMYLPKKWHVLIFLLVYTLVMNSTEEYWQDYVLGVGSFMTTMTFIYFFVVKLLRLNLAAYFLCGFLLVLIRNLRTLVTFGYPLYFPDISAILVVLLIPITLLLWLFKSGLTTPPAAEEG